MECPEQSLVNLFQAYTNTLSTHIPTLFEFIMKKLFILALALAPVASMAQATQEVTVNTTIRAAITLNKTSDLVFGQVEMGDAVSITAHTDAKSNTGSSATRAVITTTSETAVAYTFSGNHLSGNTLSLQKTAGPETAPATLNVTLNYGFNSTTPTSYTPGNSTAGTTTAMNTLYIGGSFNAPAEDAAGAVYSTTLTVTANYM